MLSSWGAASVILSDRLMTDDEEKEEKAGWEGCVALICLVLSYPAWVCADRLMLYVSDVPKAKVFFYLCVTLLGFWIGLTFSGLRRSGSANRICSRISLSILILLGVWIFLRATIFLQA